LVAASAREDARDALISKYPGGINALPQGAIVGTSSARRETQLLRLRPDLKIQMLRGNVVTRLEKLKSGQYDAIVLASAGLRRLGFEKEVSAWFSTAQMIPAVGQGILAIEARADFDRNLFEGFHDELAWECLRLERATMLALEGDCSIPLGVHAAIEGPFVRATGFYCVEGLVALAAVEGRLGDPEVLGQQLATKLLNGIRKENS
jgi:hydroxymethylbilane synthase